jgi:hypothetical protein
MPSNSPHRRKHTQKKAIREAQKQEYETEASKITEKEKKKYVTSKKTNKVTRGKAQSNKKSHKTSPDDVTWQTEPDSAHREGTRWIETVQKQTLDVAAKLSKKLQKFLKKKR